MPRQGESDRPAFPLRLHKTGQWTKHVRGKDFYFGRDRDAALAEYLRVKSDLEVGRRPRPLPSGDGPTVSRIVVDFLAARRRRVEAGELSPGTWSLYRVRLGLLPATFGPDATVEDLRADDWGKLRSAASERLGARALGQFVAIVRTAFKWAYESDMIDRPVKFGPEFAPPSRRLVRLARSERGRLDLTADECRKLIEESGIQFRAMVYLGLNCGYGSSDCSRLNRSDVSREPGWLADVRVKTATSRRCPLWPETIAALKAAAMARPKPVRADDRDAVFLTQAGRRWIRSTDRPGKSVSRRDSIGETFQRTARNAGVKVAGRFYSLRHTFRTVADETLDAVAVGLIMGHTDHSTAGHYRERIGDERLRKVTDHVRAWLIAGKAG